MMTTQVHLRLDPDVVKLVEDWRRKQTPIPSFNKAVNMVLRDLLVNKFVDHVVPVIAYDGKTYAYRVYGVPKEVKPIE
jgi:hypothetical protein